MSMFSLNIALLWKFYSVVVVWLHILINLAIPPTQIPVTMTISDSVDPITIP